MFSCLCFDGLKGAGTACPSFLFLFYQKLEGNDQDRTPNIYLLLVVLF